MSAEGTLFRDLAVILVAAGGIAALFYSLKQPVVIGYLLAGFVVGPFSPGPSFVGDGEVMGFLGEIGIIFLLFALGLEFNLQKLRKVGMTAIVAGTIEIGIMLWLGYAVGRALGWSTLESVFLGAVISISSTTVIVKVLAEMGKKDEDWAQTAFGILIIEDVLAVLILTALSGAAATGNFQPDLLGSLLWKLGVFLGASLVLGLLFAPRVVDKLAVLKVEEVMVLVAAGIGFGMALVASELGFSAGLGAFVAGAVMAESPRVAKVAHKIEPIRDLFTAIFFVWVGAQLDPSVLVANWRGVIAVTAAVLGGKIVGVTLATFLTGQSPTQSLRVGMTLAQIGEFGFVIAALGISLGVTSPALLPIAIAVSAVTALLTPYLIRASPRVVAGLSRVAPVGVRAYASAYGGWIARARSCDTHDPERESARRNGLIAALVAAVVISIVGVATAAVDDVNAAATEALPVYGRLAWLTWLGVGLLAAPFVYVWAVSMRRVIVSLARLAVPQRLRTAECTGTERILRRSFALVVTLVVGTLVLLVGSIALSSIVPVLLVVGVGVALSTASLGQSLSKFHGEIERTISRVMKADGSAVGSRDDALAAIADARAFGAGSREVMVPHVSGGAGRSIGELRLRALTGASVVSVRRAAGVVEMSPGPALRFAAGDRVLLMGEEEAIVRAEEVLLGQDLGVAGGATEVRVTARSKLAGRTLGESRIAERTGADVLVVRRAGNALSAAPDLVLAPGDVLVVIGTDEQVGAVERAASGTSP